MDQQMATFSSKTKLNRWTIAEFAYILDICRVNPATVLAINRGSDPRKINSYDFGMALGLRLTRPHVQQRSLTGLQTSIRYKIDLLLNDGVFSSRQQDASSSNNTQYPQKSENRKRCRSCISEISDPGQKKKKKRHDKNKKNSVKFVATLTVANILYKCALSATR